MQMYFLVIYLLIVNDLCKVPVYSYLLVVFVFSCLLQGRLNGSPIPTTTLSSSRLGLMTIEPPTSPGQNSEPSMYSRYWITYISVPFTRLTDENRSDPSVDVNSSPSSTYDNHRASKSADPSSDHRRQSISSHDQRLSSPSNYGEEITYSLSLSLPDMGSPSSPSSDSDLRVRSSGDSDPGISSSWRPIIIGLTDQKVKKDRGPPMILFDEHVSSFKCGEDHHTEDCTKYRSSPAKFALCSKDHTTNYKGFPVFKAAFKNVTYRLADKSIRRHTILPTPDFPTCIFHPDLHSLTMNYIHLEI